MVEHRNLASVTFGIFAVTQVDPSLGSQRLASPSMSSQEIFRSVCSGGRLVLCPTDVLTSPRVSPLIVRERIDALECTPQFWLS